MSARCVLLIAFVYAILGREAAATDVAFWSPYKTDANTYLLCGFDEKTLSQVEGAAKVGKVEAIGDAAFDPSGRFGGALRVGGGGSLKLIPSATFPGGNLAIEAWIRLERYPAKDAAIVCRPALVDKSGKHDPGTACTKGFTLLVDSAGALHLETVNCFYGRTTRTSSPPGAVPLNQWVHVAGVSDGFPIAFRRLYVDGREVQAKPVEWGQGLVLSGEEETRPGAIYLGNDDRQSAGLAGLIDQVRIHTRIVKFWPRDDAWTAQGNWRRPDAGPPHFLENHQPILHLPLDGDTRPAVNQVPGLKIEALGDHFVAGVCGKAWAGPIAISAPRLLDLRHGSLEFWLQPLGVNNYADNNRSFVGGPFTLYFVNDGGALGLKPLTLYFSKGTKAQGLHFVRDGLDTEFHSGAWYHIVITWKAKTIAMYINGRLAEKTLAQSLATAENKGVCNRLLLSPHEPIGIIDEVRLYDRALGSDEAANACYRYRAPEKRVAVRPSSLEIKARVFPSRGTIEYQCVPEGSRGGRLADSPDVGRWRREGDPSRRGRFLRGGAATSDSPHCPTALTRSRLRWCGRTAGSSRAIRLPLPPGILPGRRTPWE